MNHLRWRSLPASTLEADDAVRADWNRLNAAGLNLPFMDADAIAAALSVFRADSAQLLVAHADGAAAAMFVVVSDGRLRWHTYQPSQLPLGAWVALPGLPLNALCHALLRHLPRLAVALSVTQVDPRQQPRAEDGANDIHADYIDTAWVDVVGTFDAYWAARGKNLRQNLRKQRNKLASDGVGTSMRILRDAAEMAPAIARYGALESTGWKAGEGTAIHPDNEQGRFYTRLLADAARRCEALVFEYLFDDRTVAMNLCLARDGVLTVLKTTYDESLPKTLSPASLLREEELQHLFAAGEIRRIEYYGRVMDWHTKLTENRRTIYHLTTYRWPWLRKLAQRRRAAATRAAEATPGSMPTHAAIHAGTPEAT